MNKTLTSYNPSNGHLIDKVIITNSQEIGNSVERAKLAAKKWRAIPIQKRVEYLTLAAEAMEPHLQAMAILLSEEMGKDIRRSSGEVQGAMYGISYYAQSAMDALKTRQLAGNTQLQYRPLGVAAVISPWNYPLAMANNLIVPALIAGNTVVFKSSEETPLVAKRYVEILNTVLPENVLQIVYGDGETGQQLVESPVDIIAFTGSQAVGKKIMASAASGVKRLVMELGGNDPMIVMANANLEAAARFAVASSFENAGQMCTSTERIYVDEKIADKFEKRVTEIAQGYSVGPWDQAGVNIGPIINHKQHSKILQHIKDAELKGARVLLGGSVQTAPYITPTVLSQITPEMKMEQEETFGPVVSISRYQNLDDAIAQANNSNYGLGAVVFGGQGSAEVAEQLEAGMVAINSGPGGSGDAPWVGAKQSGIGFHGSSDGHRQFAQVRVLSK